MLHLDHESPVAVVLTDIHVISFGQHWEAFGNLLDHSFIYLYVHIIILAIWIVFVVM